MENKTPKPFSISMNEARHMMMENSLDMWSKEECERNGIDKTHYLFMYHDKDTNVITFYPIKTTWLWRLKTKILKFFGIEYLVRFVPPTNG